MESRIGDKQVLPEDSGGIQAGGESVGLDLPSWELVHGHAIYFLDNLQVRWIVV